MLFVGITEKMVYMIEILLLFYFMNFLKKDSAVRAKR